MTRQLRREQGSVLVVAMVALMAMMSVGALSILSVQGGVKSVSDDRFRTIALNAAESGASAGLDFLRENCDVTTLFSQFVPDASGEAKMPEGIYGNNVKPGELNNPFNVGLRAWYQLTILNNAGDPGQLEDPPVDTDSQLVLHVVGYGPDNTQVTIEMEIRNDACLKVYCDSGYAQQGTALNAPVSGDADPCAVDVEITDETRVINP